MTKLKNHIIIDYDEKGSPVTLKCINFSFTEHYLRLALHYDVADFGQQVDFFVFW